MMPFRRAPVLRSHAPVMLLAVFVWGCTSSLPPTRPSPTAAPVPVTTVYVVRHAERAPGQGDVPLSEAGHARARALRDSLASRGVSGIFVSQFRRTAETARPLAEATGLPVVVRALEITDIKASAQAVARAVAAEYAGRTVVVVGHSNTVPAMVDALAGTTRPDLDDHDYDGLYVVRIAGGQATVVRLRYGADDGTPDPAG